MYNDFSIADQPFKAWAGKPFLKWAGNKNRAKQFILPHLGNGKRLVEPFAGSCAIALNSNFDEFLLCDVNGDLIDLFNFIKSDHMALLEEGRRLFVTSNNAEWSFYGLREEFNATSSSVRKSAIFIYLNRHGFNGLCRYNSKGGFNVPFGRYKAPQLPEREIKEFAEFAKRAIFKQQGFEETFDEVRFGDVIYCDPPYVPLTGTSNFTSYATEAFGTTEQVNLAECANKSAKNGHRTLVSNHDIPYTRKLYKDATITSFEVTRLISAKASTRGKASELLATFNA